MIEYLTLVIASTIIILVVLGICLLYMYKHYKLQNEFDLYKREKEKQIRRIQDELRDGWNRLHGR